MNQGGYDLRRDVDKLLNKTTELAKDYYIQINSPIITFKDDVFTPSILTATAYESSQDLTDFYEGILDLWVSTDEGNTYTFVKRVNGHTISQAMTDIFLTDRTIDIDDVTHFRINMYDESFNILDRQTTAIVKTKDGKDAITILLGNETQLIAVDGNGSLKSNPTTITIPVYCYKGTNKVAGTINLNGVSNTFSSKTKVDPTQSNNGSVTLSCTSVPNQITGDEPIAVTVDGETIIKHFTWNKIGDGKDGNAGGTYDFVYYTKNNDTPPSISSSTVINPNTGRNAVNGWCARPTNTSATYPYCFGAYRKLDHTGTPTGNYSDVYLWAKYGEKGADGEDGEDGADGKGLEMIFCQTTTLNGYSTNPSTLPAVQTPDYVPNGWTDDQTGVDSAHPYEYVCLRTSNASGTWSIFTAPRLWAKYGENGVDGKGLEIEDVVDATKDAIDLNNINAVTLNNNTSDDFIKIEPEGGYIEQFGTEGYIEYKKLGRLIIITVYQWRVENLRGTLSGYEPFRYTPQYSTSTLVQIPAAYRSSRNMFAACGVSTANTNSVTARMNTEGNLHMANPGFVSTSAGETVSCSFVFFADNRTPSTITVDSTTGMTVGDKLGATLTDNNGDVLAGRLLIFKVNGVNYSRMTDSSGKAYLPLMLPGNQNYNFTVTFNGDTDNSSVATSNNSFTLGKASIGDNNITITNDKIRPNDYIRGILTNSKGNPLKGLKMTIALGQSGQSIYYCNTLDDGSFAFTHPNDNIEYNNLEHSIRIGVEKNQGNNSQYTDGHWKDTSMIFGR